MTESDPLSYSSAGSSERYSGDSTRPEAMLQPTVAWPRIMTRGRRHLVSVDLAVVDRAGNSTWELPNQGDYAYTTMVTAPEFRERQFAVWAVEDAAVVVRRSGGSYGPANFIVVPKLDCPLGEYALGLNILNAGGIQVGYDDLQFTLSDDIPPAM